MPSGSSSSAGPQPPPKKCWHAGESFPTRWAGGDESSCREKSSRALLRTSVRRASSSSTAHRSLLAASPTYESDDFRKHLPGLPVEHHFSELVKRRRLCVDHDHPGAGPDGDQRNFCGRINDKRRTDDQHHVGVTRQRERLLDR